MTVAIPTMGRVETLGMTLFSVFQQMGGLVKEVLILDEAKIPVCESYQVNQAIDLLCLNSVEVKVLRSRDRKGIGPARWRLVSEARGALVMMVDDDVALDANCIFELEYCLREGSLPWAVPHCLLIPDMGLDGYRDKVVSRSDKDVVKWVSKYPWFLPYFRYDEVVEERLRIAGTQAILFRRDEFLQTCVGIESFGKLPREDTYITTSMGEGGFTSKAECYHFEHNAQQERTWGREMFYKLHEIIAEHPEEWRKLL